MVPSSCDCTVVSSNCMSVNYTVNGVEVNQMVYESVGDTLSNDNCFNISHMFSVYILCAGYGILYVNVSY